MGVGSGITCASVWTRMCVTCLCLVAWEVDHKAADALQWEALVVDVLPLEVQAADVLHRVAREADDHQLEAQAVAALEVDPWAEVALGITPGAQPLLHLVGMMRWSQESKATLTRAHAIEFPQALVAAILQNLTSKSLSTRGGGLLSPTKCRTIRTSTTKCSQIPTRLANDISISLSHCNLQRDHQCSEQGWGRLEPP